jgi:hypothetical protein
LHRQNLVERRTCPIHGTPKAGKRIRKYIGSDPQRQATAERAIENELHSLTLQTRRKAITNRLSDATAALVRFYRQLGYQVTKDPPAVTIIKNWEPRSYLW